MIHAMDLQQSVWTVHKHVNTKDMLHVDQEWIHYQYYHSWYATIIITITAIAAPMTTAVDSSEDSYDEW